MEVRYYGNAYQTHLSKLHILDTKNSTESASTFPITHVIELYKTYNKNIIHDIHRLQILILVLFFSP